MSASDWSNIQWAGKIAEKIASLEAETSPTQQFSDKLTPPALAQLIDHTLLKPDCTADQIDQLCEEAKEYGFKSCCVYGSHVQRAAASLADTSCAVACVIGFPHGASHPSTKLYEANTAVTEGARELDMVLALGRLKARDYAAVYREISQVKCGVAPMPLLKVIVETALLDEAQIVAACFIAAEAGADFVKTCTGFGGGGATVEHVALMRRAVAYKGGSVKVKASGGVRSLGDALAMVRAGAERIGTSAGLLIMKEALGISGEGVGDGNDY